MARDDDTMEVERTEQAAAPTQISITGDDGGQPRRSARGHLAAIGENRTQEGWSTDGESSVNSELTGGLTVASRLEDRSIIGSVISVRSRTDTMSVQSGQPSREASRDTAPQQQAATAEDRHKVYIAVKGDDDQTRLFTREEFAEKTGGFAFEDNAEDYQIFIESKQSGALLTRAGFRSNFDAGDSTDSKQRAATQLGNYQEAMRKEGLDPAEPTQAHKDAYKQLPGILVDDGSGNITLHKASDYKSLDHAIERNPGATIRVQNDAGGYQTPGQYERFHDGYGAADKQFNNLAGIANEGRTTGRADVYVRTDKDTYLSAEKYNEGLASRSIKPPAGDKKLDVLVQSPQTGALLSPSAYQFATKSSPEPILEKYGLTKDQVLWSPRGNSRPDGLVATNKDTLKSVQAAKAELKPGEYPRDRYGAGAYYEQNSGKAGLTGNYQSESQLQTKLGPRYEQHMVDKGVDASKELRSAEREAAARDTTRGAAANANRARPDNDYDPNFRQQETRDHGRV